MITNDQSMNELTNVIPRERVEELQAALAKMPQAIGNGLAKMETDHFFAGGMYCRRFFIPATLLIVSKVHKTEHLFIGCSGSLVVVGQGPRYVLRAGDVVVSPIGTKRIVYAEEDCIVMTVHKTDITEVEKLEAELMEIDPTALFDVSNRPKPGVLVADAPARIGN